MFTIGSSMSNTGPGIQRAFNQDFEFLFTHKIINDYSCKVISTWDGLQVRYTQPKVEQRLLRPHWKGTRYPEMRENRICFTFYPIAPPGRDVKFKYSTQLPFCIPKWMKQHLMTYYKTILISVNWAIFHNQIINVATPKQSKRYTLVTGGFFR